MPYKLLLADDSVTIQRVIELTFADEDVQVTAVSDGDQAIASLDADPPDIVLADVGMPGPNGYEVAAYVKQSPRLAHVPVVLLTGAFEPVDQARAESAGCDGVLAKPFEPQLVIARVKELLARQRPAARDGTVPAPPPAFEPLAPPDLGTPAEETPAASPSIDEYFDRLDAHVQGNGPPMVILGESGLGKSALVSNWAKKFQEKHPGDFFLMHFIGSTAQSTDWAAMLRRIMGEIKQRVNLPKEIPDKPEQLRAEFPNW